MPTLAIPGHVTLEPMEVPDGLTGWNGILPFGSSSAAEDAAHDGIVVAVLIEDPATEGDLDSAFIASVLDDVDGMLRAAADAVRTAVADEPARFGAEAGTEFGLDGPELTFGLGRSWTLRFAECSLPASLELGVAVYFDGTTPLEVDELADVDDADDEHEHEHEHDEHDAPEHGAPDNA